MKIFKKPYTVRRYQKPSWEGGLPGVPYRDITLNLDVQDNRRKNQGDRGGRSTSGSLTVYSNIQLFPAEPSKQIDADRLLFMGRWYVCTEAVYWGNTILAHWTCTFEAVEGEEPEEEEGDKP